MENNSHNFAVFLDMQGTLGGDGTGDIMGFSFYPFAIEAIKLLNQRNILAIVITNQSHISKGYLSMDDYYRKLEELKEELKNQGAFIDAVYCCPHAAKDHCDCKKPLPGLIKQAESDFNIDSSKSYVIGDMGSTDMVLSRAIGAKGILVRTGVGEGSLSEFRNTWSDIEPYYIASDVLEAVKRILQCDSV